MKRKTLKQEKQPGHSPDIKRWFYESFETAPFGILIHDKDGNFLLFNRYLEELTGHTRDTMPDLQSWITKIYPDQRYRQMVLKQRSQPIPVGELRVRQSIITTKEGQKRICRFSSKTSATGVRTIMIQDLKSAQTVVDLAIEGYEKSQSQFQSTPTPLLLWALQGRDFALSSYNKAAEKLTSGKIGIYLGKSILEVLEDPVPALEDMLKCAAEKTNVECDEPYHLPGTEADSFFDCTFLPMPDDFVLMHLSIRTQFIRTRENLQESEQRYRDLVDMLPITIFETDVEANLTFCNRSGLETFGYTEADIEKKLNATKFLVDRDVDRAVANIARAMAGETIGVNEYTAKTKSGKEIPIALRSSPIYKGGELIGLRGFSFDMSELREAQDALKKAYAEMENIVAERTQELKAKTEELLEVNTALRVLLREQHMHQNEIEDRIQLNANQLILPHLVKLKKSQLSKRQQSWLRQASTSLQNITSPLGQTISSHFEKLSPTELQVADLIKNGKTTKEIADILDLAIRTIESHRKNIRRKLGLQNKKVNLRTHLLSL